MRYSYFAGNARLDWRSRRRRAECIGAGAGDWDVDGDGRPWHSTRLPHDVRVVVAPRNYTIRHQDVDGHRQPRQCTLVCYGDLAAEWAGISLLR